MEFKELIKNEFVFLDGAMGTMLQNSGMEPGEIPEILNIKNPELIAGIHEAYAKAGADIVYANTFGANRIKLSGSGYSVSDVIRAGIANAKHGAGGSALTALDIGPIGQLLEPTGSLSPEEAYDIFKEEVIAGSDADIIVVETMTDLAEMRAALLAAKENSDKPVLCTMSFEENMRTFTGCSISAMAMTLEGLGADSIGFNCSLGPDKLLPMVEELARWTSLPIVVKPNAGLPDPLTNKYNLPPAEFAEIMEKLADLGVKYIGGCCGTSPKYITALKERFAGHKFSNACAVVPPAVCTATNTVVIDRPRIIGERINPTGKKLFKEALLKGDMPYILNQATEQESAGTDILDVNVGLPGINEAEMMVRTVKALGGITSLPLQIDSSDPTAIEAALRIYSGKAIVNSVNGEDESLSKILPVVKKYGAAVVGLTLDKEGVPKTAEKRFAIAEKILNKALSYGIKRENVFIDCLTLTASAEQECVMETLKALKMVKEKLGLKTVLGVSNISFGLPNRELINSRFLCMALSYGLDLPIINPNIEAMTGTVRAFNLLSGTDANSSEFISVYGEKEPAAAPVSAQKSDYDIPYCIDHGLKENCAALTGELLKTTPPMAIINDILIPSLDRVGAGFEKGEIFLPQLILAAGVAEAAFDVIKSKLAESGQKSESKGPIVLATVKGDIHDIGKNIVKVLLENYGYEVIDLGKDVPPEKVVEAALKSSASLVGLSALMTTTLKGMAETIKLLKQQSKCKIMVGGAVLTPEYAAEIGADFYAKDAKESVDIAKKVIG